MTECSRCGDCCDPVILTDKMWGRIRARSENTAIPIEHRDAHIEATWLLEHWTVMRTVDGGVELHCDMFDPATRLCTAHDDRPAVCSEFPWYSKPPSNEDVGLSPRCSYWADLPEDQRPVEWVPVEFAGLTA